MCHHGKSDFEVDNFARYSPLFSTSWPFPRMTTESPGFVLSALTLNLQRISPPRPANEAACPSSANPVPHPCRSGGHDRPLALLRHPVRLQVPMPRRRASRRARSPTQKNVLGNLESARRTGARLLRVRAPSASEQTNNGMRLESGAGVRAKKEKQGKKTMWIEVWRPRRRWGYPQPLWKDQQRATRKDPASSCQQAGQGSGQASC